MRMLLTLCKQRRQGVPKDIQTLVQKSLKRVRCRPIHKHATSVSQTKIPRHLYVVLVTRGPDSTADIQGPSSTLDLSSTTGELFLHDPGR